MDRWSPIFSKIVDSSLWAEPDYVCKVFVTMLALKDSDHVVRFNAFGLGKRCHKDEAEVLAALKILSSPDKKRMEPQPYEGRRIEKVPEGWLVLNGQAYETLMREMNRRIYKARKEREYRQKRSEAPNPPGRSQPLPGESAGVRAWENGHQEDPHP